MCRTVHRRVDTRGRGWEGGNTGRGWRATGGSHGSAMHGVGTWAEDLLSNPANRPGVRVRMHASRNGCLHVHRCEHLNTIYLKNKAHSVFPTPLLQSESTATFHRHGWPPPPFRHHCRFHVVPSLGEASGKKRLYDTHVNVSPPLPVPLPCPVAKILSRPDCEIARLHARVCVAMMMK